MVLIVIREPTHTDVADLVSGKGVLKGHEETPTDLEPSPFTKLEPNQAHEHMEH
jgi:hypothetical protein